MKHYFTNCFVAGLMATQALAMAGADVVSEGIHYTTNDAEKTAYATYALFPTIRTGAPMLSYSVKSPHPICYYDESENYTNIGALVVPEAVGECTVTKIGDYAFNNSGVTSVEIGKKCDNAWRWRIYLEHQINHREVGFQPHRDRRFRVSPLYAAFQYVVPKFGEEGGWTLLFGM